MPADAAPIVLVSQLLFCDACFATFFGGGGTAFFAPIGCDPMGFLTAGALADFFAAVAGVMGFFIGATAGFL
jgi:hypothetical protein